jgi:heterodisulfide reductase subunit B
MNIGYFPGCALHGSSNDYGQSVESTMSALGVTLEEVDDWICCGATAAHSLNPKLALALPARNLALAARQGHAELLAPCAMCSHLLVKAGKAVALDAALRAEIASIVEADLDSVPRVYNLIQAIERIGLENVKKAVTRPLADLKPACYYGCLLVRPPDVAEFDDCEQPRSMEAIVSALGAKPVDWGARTECCGAGMTMASPETVLALSAAILGNAAAHGANCLVVACPMCHVNLDMKQSEVEKAAGVRYGLPVYYLSDLVGMALGRSEKEVGADRHFVPTLAGREA